MKDSLKEVMEGVGLMIELSVESVRINLATQQRVVILKALHQDRYMFIWIAQAEAYAIAVHLEKSISPRPLTHDVMKKLIESMGARVLRVVISDLVDEIFYSQIVLEVAGKEREIDTRPSDAIALAVRVNAPIFVTEQVWERCSIDPEALSAPTDPKFATSPPAREPKEAEQKPTTVETGEEAETANMTTLQERLAQVEEELRKAQVRIAELERQ
jgi:uncharacterized protein